MREAIFSIGSCLGLCKRKACRWSSLRRYEIIAKTGFSSGNSIERRIGFCIVRWFGPDGNVQEYSTHIMIDTPDNLVSGDYHQDLKMTVDLFYKRIFEHNQLHRFGNPSHVPINDDFSVVKCFSCAHYVSDGRMCEFWGIEDPEQDSNINEFGCHEYIELKDVDWMGYWLPVERLVRCHQINGYSNIKYCFSCPYFSRIIPTSARNEPAQVRCEFGRAWRLPLFFFGNPSGPPLPRGGSTRGKKAIRPSHDWFIFIRERAK